MTSFSLAEHLARVADPRQDSGKRHILAALLNLVAVAVLCGLRSLEAIAQFGRSLNLETARELSFTHPKTPCKSTRSVVLRAVDASALEQELRAWAPQHETDAGPVAVDGKTVRDSADGVVAAVHLLAVYAVDSGVTLAQGAPAALETQAAQETLQRLEKRRAASP